MKEYKCKRCGYDTYKISNLKQHLSRGFQCAPLLADIDPLALLDDLKKDFTPGCRKCTRCSRVLASKQSLDRHMLVCKTDNIIPQQLQDLRTELSALKQVHEHDTAPEASTNNVKVLKKAHGSEHMTARQRVRSLLPCNGIPQVTSLSAWPSEYLAANGVYVLCLGHDPALDMLVFEFGQGVVVDRVKVHMRDVPALKKVLTMSVGNVNARPVENTIKTVVKSHMVDYCMNNKNNIEVFACHEAEAAGLLQSIVDACKLQHNDIIQRVDFHNETPSNETEKTDERHVDVLLAQLEIEKLRLQITLLQLQKSN